MKSGWMGPKWGFSSLMKNRYSLYFLIFCMRLQTHKELKFNWIFFLEKKVIVKFLGQKGPIRVWNEVFQVLWTINTWKYSDFLHKVTPRQDLKNDSNDFLCEIFSIGVFREKEVQIEYCEFCNKSIHWIYFIYHRNWQNYLTKYLV